MSWSISLELLLFYLLLLSVLCLSPCQPVSPSTLAPVGWSSLVGKEVSGSKATSCPAASSQEGACLCCVGHNDNGGQLTSAPRVKGQQLTPRVRQLGVGWCCLSTVVSVGGGRSGPAPDYDLAFSLHLCLAGDTSLGEERYCFECRDSGLVFQHRTLQDSWAQCREPPNLEAPLEVTCDPGQGSSGLVSILSSLILSYPGQLNRS